MTHPVPFAYKESIPQGMRGTIEPTAVGRVLATLTEILGKAPSVKSIFTETVEHVAVVGAMTDALIREAAARKIDLYITGQFRQSAARAVQETEMTVAKIGHTDGERWGLRALASLLRERWNHLDVTLAQQSPAE